MIIKIGFPVIPFLLYFPLYSCSILPLLSTRYNSIQNSVMTILKCPLRIIKVMRTIYESTLNIIPVFFHNPVYQSYYHSFPYTLRYNTQLNSISSFKYTKLKKLNNQYCYIPFLFPTTHSNYYHIR